MPPSFQADRDDVTCAALARLAPEVGELVRELRGDARRRGFSPLDVLLERGLATPELYRRALRAAEHPAVAWGPFVVDAELGRGAHGVVYLASHEGVRCALKLLRGTPGEAPATRAERLRREGALLARLAHPGIVRLVDAGALEGAPYVATEAILGGSLEDLGRCDPDRALELAAGVAGALAHAHSVGVVHRDLKPSNVLLDAGRPRVVDFGLAKDLRGEGPTQSRAHVGTLPYAAPEQLVAAKDVDGRADVFALAATLHALLEGAPPYAGARTVGDYFRACARGPSPLAPRPGLDRDLAAALDAVLRRALAADPVRRSTMEDLARDLSFLGGKLAREGAR